ncbi:hypothetical protein [Mesorhizobium sanjuanii]|uniref:hypothetical protein n=1 Tax=Mesorhizobium sanjuanii TaxID=2037900 RepID=UPI001AD7E66E|nr:hypothetical protein [Mesorhizobium sanjuanii]
MIRGLLAATALTSIAATALAHDVQGAVQAALAFIIVLLVSLYGRERHVSATI